MEILTDQQRVADIDNPRGYYEFEAVKNLGEDSSWIPTARGKAIKVVSLLLYHLPATENYRVIFMQRNLDEVVLSQEAMLKHFDRSPPSRAEISEAFRDHLEHLTEWIETQSNIQLLNVDYSALMNQSRTHSERIASFLGIDLNIEAMQQAVDPSLYRNRNS